MSEFAGEVGTVMAYLRDGTSYVIYNYYVEADDLGGMACYRTCFGVTG